MEAKRQFLAQANPTRAFVTQVCRTAPDKSVSTNELFAAFEAWRKADRGKTSYTRIAFTKRIEAMGFELFKSGVNRVRGLEIRQPGDEGDA